MTVEIAAELLLPFDATPLARVLERLLVDHDAGEAGLTVIVVDDVEMTRLHREFMDIDETTDCMSFPADEAGELGEVYLSLDVARREAETRGVPLETEVLLYAVHGALHLLGHDDTEPAAAEAMRALELRYAGLRGDG